MARKSIYPPSVTPGIPRLGEKPKGWIETTFGDVLQVVARKADVHDTIEYQLVTAKRNRGGIVPRCQLLGRDILTKTQFRIRTGDFLISRRQIIHGACGIVPPELDGALVSNEYATLRVRDGLVLKFLDYLSHTAYFQQTCFQSSVGVDVEKMIFGLREWLKYRVYLPPLQEQQRIVDILSTWDEAIALTEQLIAAKQRHKKGLMQRLLADNIRFGRSEGQGWRQVRQDITFINPAKPDHLRGDTLVSFLAMSDISEAAQIASMAERPYSEVRTGYTSFQEDDVLVAKITPCFENGKGALVHGLKSGFGFGSTEFHVLRANRAMVLPEFVYYHTIADEFRGKGKASMVGSAGQKRVRTHFIKSYRIMLPSLPEQQRITDVLRACDAEIALLVEKRNALQSQKKGLMQQLLTGRVRVKA